MQAGFLCTLIPEPFTLNRETGIGESGRGFGEKAAGETEAVVVVLQEGCFFSELRVITLITKKYSILKTTTTDYHILDLPLPPQSPQPPPKSRRSIFFSTPYYIQTNPPKNRTPTGGVSGLPLLFPLAEDLSQTIEKIF